jgi:hypothetical protein
MQLLNNLKYWDLNFRDLDLRNNPNFIHVIESKLGGQPTLHPEFVESYEIMQELTPDKRKESFWPAGKT